MKKIKLCNDKNWGSYYASENIQTSDKCDLRLTLYTSGIAEITLINSILTLKKILNLNIEVTGVATDDVEDGNAKISIKKRLWKYYSDEEKIALFNDLKNLCIENNIEFYTGCVKCDDFRNILHEKWRPDISICAFYGQIFDSDILSSSKINFYNFHPSDLKNSIGAGSQPYDQPIKNGYATIKMSLHELTEKIDSGFVIDQSPHVNILKNDLNYPDDMLTITHKIFFKCIPYMAANLILSAIISIKNGSKITNLKYSYPEGFCLDLIKFIETPCTMDFTQIENLIKSFIIENSLIKPL